MQNRQANPQYNTPQGHMQGNYGPPQNYPPQQNYGPPGQGDRRNPMPMSNMDRAPAGREPASSHQGNYNQWGQQSNYYNQQQRDMPQGDPRNYGPAQNDFRGNNMNYAPNSPNGSFGQGGQGGSGYRGQGVGGGYGQGGDPNYGQGNMEQGGGPSFSQGDWRSAQGDQEGSGGPNKVKLMLQSVIGRACE